uniref:Uncharacterized protein n=1 Tax=Glossina pallidipes TaxID=7398 RepID=A0A1A9ZSH5_GLOPL
MPNVALSFLLSNGETLVMKRDVISKLKSHNRYGLCKEITVSWGVLDNKTRYLNVLQQVDAMIYNKIPDGEKQANIKVSAVTTVDDPSKGIKIIIGPSHLLSSHYSNSNINGFYHLMPTLESDKRYFTSSVFTAAQMISRQTVFTK